MKKNLIMLLMFGTIMVSLTACATKAESETTVSTEVITETAETESVTEQESHTETESETEPPVREEILSGETDTYAMKDISFHVPVEWEFVKDRDEYSFYPESGIVSGEHHALLQVRTFLLNIENRESPEVIEEVLDGFEESIASHENSTLLSKESLTIGDHPCIYINNHWADENISMDQKHYFFVYGDYQYAITFGQRDDITIIYDNVVKEIISSVVLHQETEFDENTIESAAFEPVTPFFAYAENANIWRYCTRNLKYDKLEQLVTEYINKYNPEEEHVTVKMRAALSEYEGGNGLICEYDSFEDMYYTRYEGYTGIDSSHYIYPYLKGSSYYLRLGFVRNDWLFADRMKLKRDSAKDSIIFAGKSYNFEREVLSGGTVREYKEERLYDEYVDYLADDMTEGMTLRFSSGEEKFFDYVLTETDKTALQEVARCAVLKRKLNDLYTDNE